MSRLTRDGTSEPVSRDQILRHERGQGNIHFSCSADHEQDWQPYPVDPYSAICDDHTIHTCVTSVVEDTKIPGTEVVEANSLYRVSFFIFLARALSYCSLYYCFVFMLSLELSP